MQQFTPPRVQGHVKGAVNVMTISGRVGWPALGTFQDDLSRQLRRTPDVVIDLADLDSWSVTAQALFIVAVHQARQRGTAVAVVDLKDRAWLQLERSGLAPELYKTLWAMHRPVQSPAPPAA